MDSGNLILVTGASGYIGGNLIPHLLAKGYNVRCLARDPAALYTRSWFSQVETIKGDVLVNETLKSAMEGVSTAYYLIHSMASGRHHGDRDITGARNFASAANLTGVEHIIYLGGLADPKAKIGYHMQSRLKTGDVLRQAGVPVTEFRAGVIVGPGSISFEMIRYLTEQIPLMVGPQWMHNRTQPVAIEDVLNYLLAAMETDDSRGQIIEIGGAEVLTFAEAISIYAQLRGLKRRLLTMPMIPLELMAFGVDKLTPVTANIAYPLIEGMCSDSVVRDDAARRIFPHIRPLSYPAAVSIALSKLTPAQLEAVWENWSSPLVTIKHAGFLIQSHQIRLKIQPQAIYRAFTELGGKHGWLYMNWLWQLRGLLDRLMGGPGMRGRREDQTLEVGDIVDFYRLDAMQPGYMIRLQAELKAPGAGWMEWRVEPLPEGEALLSQVAYFTPNGLPGFLYWYLLYPVHRLVFAGLIKQIARRAKEIQDACIIS